MSSDGSNSGGNEDDGNNFEPIVYAVGGVAFVLAIIVCVLIIVLCRIIYIRQKRRKHQISTNPDSNQGTALTTLTTTASTTNKRYAFSASGRQDANSIVKSDTSTTSSNHIRVSDGSASSGHSTKADVMPPTVEPLMNNIVTNHQHPKANDIVSADYAEIEEDNSHLKLSQKGDTLQSAADSTLSTVSSFNSSMRDSALLYDGGMDSFLDNLEPGAHNTPKFPIKAVQLNDIAVNSEYEKDPSYSHDYEQDPNYQKKKKYISPLPPPHIYQALQQHPQQSSREAHYKAPEKTLRPVSEKLPRVTEQPDYADAIPHSNSLSTPQTQNYNYTDLRASTLDPLPHYTHLDISTKEHTRGSGLSYVTTDL